MRNKKGLALTKYVLAMFLFVIFVTGAYITANTTGGFWDAYDYDPPTNNLSSFNKMNELIDQTNTLENDLDNNVLTDNLIGQMVLGGYGALKTVKNMWSIPKTLLNDAGALIGIPPFFTTGLYYALLITIIITIILIIFNRSDTA